MACNTGFFDQGGLSCGNNKTKRIDQILYVPLKTSAGAIRNWADVETLKTFLDSAVNAVEKLDRVYPTFDELEEYAIEKSDDKVKEWKSGRKTTLDNGIYTFSYQDKNASGATVYAFEQMNGVEMGAILIDKDGGILIREKDSELYPIPIVKGSFDSSMALDDGTDTSVHAGMLKFDMKDIPMFEMKTLTADSIGESLLSLYQPRIAINASYSNVTTTGARVRLTKIDENTAENAGLEGLLLADLGGLAVVGGSAVVPTSVTAVTGMAGYYDVVYPAQSSSAVLVWTWSKDGYNFDPANEVRTTIP